MMSLSAINRASERATERARKRKAKPLEMLPAAFESDQTLERALHGMPFIGDYIPTGWRRAKAADLVPMRLKWKCVPNRGWPDDGVYIEIDTSGLGSTAEPAMTKEEFIGCVRGIGPGYAYAIVEAGEFQAVVGVFAKEKK